MVEVLLSSSCSVNQRAVYGRTAVHEAAQHGNLPLLLRLLEAGGQVDPHSNYDLTPLALATLAGHTDIISTLLERGEACSHMDRQVDRQTDRQRDTVDREVRQVEK